MWKKSEDWSEHIHNDQKIFYFETKRKRVRDPIIMWYDIFLLFDVIFHHLNLSFTNFYFKNYGQIKPQIFGQHLEQWIWKLEHIDYLLFHRYDKDLSLIINMFKSSFKCYIKLKEFNQILKILFCLFKLTL